MLVFFYFSIFYVSFEQKLDVFLLVQKARLARIQIAKATSGAAFVAKKRAAEARLAAQVTISFFLFRPVPVWFFSAFQFDKICKYWLFVSGQG